MEEKALDMNGVVIRTGDKVKWHDSETGETYIYEVFGEPTCDMVKLYADFGQYEVYPEQCEVVTD